MFSLIALFGIGRFNQLSSLKHLQGSELALTKISDDNSSDENEALKNKSFSNMGIVERNPQLAL